jgi:hypothetical protein
VTQTLQSGGFQGDNAISQVKDLLTKPKVIVHGAWDGKS